MPDVQCEDNGLAPDTRLDWSAASLLHRPPTTVEAWRRYDGDERRLTAHVTARMIDLAELDAGSCVLDLATGRGEPALTAAAAVAPSGVVVGTDVSAAMLDFARERAARQSASNLQLFEAAAERLDGVPDQRFDATLCRWGLMFFDRPGQAMDAARRRMKKGAPLVAAVWAEPHQVPWWTLPRAVLARHVLQPSTETRGLFRYASADVLRADLDEHGFDVDHEEEVHTLLVQSTTPIGLVEWCLAFGLASVLQSQPETVRQAWMEDMLAEAERYRGADGQCGLGGVTRIVRARARAR